MYIDVEEITFNRGFYTIDIRYFYKVRGEALGLTSSPTEFCGLSVFDKRVILFGSEGNARIFTSQSSLNNVDPATLGRTNMPTAVVDAVDPVVLGMRLADRCDCCLCDYDVIGSLPSFIYEAFDDSLILTDTEKRVYVTLGQFSIIRLERDSQLLMPAYDYCMPEKECVGSNDDSPCDLFNKICFPVDEFFPPDTVEYPESYREAQNLAAR